MRSILALAIFVFAAPAFAQPAASPGKAAKIERLLVLTNSRSGVDQLTAQIFKSMPSMIPADAPPARRAKFEEAQKKSMELIKQKLSWQRLKPQYAKLYEEVFTPAEIDGMLAFYESPIGQSMMKKMPMLVQRSMAIGQSAFNEILPELQRLQKQAAAQ